MSVEKDSVFFRILNAFKAKTATEVAERLGLSPQAVSKWNKDGGMKFTTLNLISNQTGVSIHWLLTGEGEKYITKNAVFAFLPAAADEGEWTLFSSLVDGKLRLRLQRGDVEINYTIASITHNFNK